MVVVNFYSMRDHNYFAYILTNKHKTVLYTEVTNDLKRRVYEHENGIIPGFAKNTIAIIWFGINVSSIFNMPSKEKKK